MVYFISRRPQKLTIPCFPLHAKSDARSSLVKIHQLGLLVEINSVVYRFGALTDERTHGRHTSASMLRGVQRSECDNTHRSYVMIH